MDDARLANEMTLEGIAKRLDGIDNKLTAVDNKISTLDSKVSALDSKVSTLDSKVGTLDGKVTGLEATVTSLKSDVATLDQRMTAGFKSVDQQLNAAKIRDEELHGFMKYGLEAREALRESMETGFSAIDKKLDQDIGLVKDVLRHLSGS